MTCAMAALLSACGTTGPATDGCAGFAPIYISQDDMLTEGTAIQIEAHNLYGADQGYWPGPRTVKN